MNARPSDRARMPDAGCRILMWHPASIWHLASSMGSQRSTPKCVNDLVHDWRMEKNSSGIRHPPSPKVPKATIDWCRGGRGGGHRMADARGNTWAFLAPHTGCVECSISIHLHFERNRTTIYSIRVFELTWLHATRVHKQETGEIAPTHHTIEFVLCRSHNVPKAAGRCTARRKVQSDGS